MIYLSAQSGISLPLKGLNKRLAISTTYGQNKVGVSGAFLLVVCYWILVTHQVRRQTKEHNEASTHHPQMTIPLPSPIRVLNSYQAGQRVQMRA